MPPHTADLLQGPLDFLILRTLRTQPLHGWAIAERIEQISHDVLQVNRSSLYPARHRLERPRVDRRPVGWVGVVPAGGILPAHGGRAPRLDTEATERERMSAGINRIMRLA